jgi:hypothetical protein
MDNGPIGQSAALMNEAAIQLTIPIETIGVSGTAS